MRSTDGSPVLRTFSLAEVAAMVLPREWTDGERWLARRLNRGEIHGYKLGRTWRMTEADVTAMIDHYSNTVEAPPEHVHHCGQPPKTVADGLSARSRRRLKSSP
ncbi:hypothetical protein A5732_16900 [Mycobacterium colombiense]|nr:hypothetical protein A5732_16900 [Mycobacterium colombiense]